MLFSLKKRGKNTFYLCAVVRIEIRKTRFEPAHHFKLFVEVYFEAMTALFGNFHNVHYKLTP